MDFNIIKKGLLGTVFAMPLLAFSASAADQSAPAETNAPATTTIDGGVNADPALYKISDEDTNIYVLGTIHVLPEDYRWFDGEIKTAFEASDELVLEVVAPAPDVMQGIVMELAVDPEGKTVRSYFDEDMKTQYESRLTSLGIPAESFDVFEPWMVSVTLSAIQISSMGLNPEVGVESVLTAAAEASDKPINGLETAAQQLGFFDDLSKQAQLDMLESGIEDWDEAPDMLNTMLSTWSQGDISGLADLLNEEMSAQEELQRVLLTARNVRWAEWVKTRLDTPGTVFMAVGAGHIAGEGSLFDVLNDDGIQAVRLSK